MIPVDQVSAGPALDTAAARALGWQRMKFPSDFGEGVVECWWDGIRRIERFEPSINIADAWELVEYRKVKDCFCDEYAISISYVFDPNDGSAEWNVEFASGKLFKCGISEGWELPLAITRAFLKTCGVVEVEDGTVH